MREVPVGGINHPAYRSVVDAVTAEVSARVAKDAERRGNASPVVMTLVLDSVLAAELGKEFPEFRLVNYGMDKVVHLKYQAYAYMMNELMLHFASKMTTDVVHVGGSLLSSLLTPGMDVHVELDVSQVSAVHERHRDARNTMRLMGNYASLMAEPAFSQARHRYDSYLRGENYLPCSSGVCGRKAEVYCVDVARNAISPAQFVAGAIQADASVAFAFFPFHPEMLARDKGEIPGTQVYYEMDFKKGELRMRYPEGVCGAEVFSLSHWAAWLMEHVVAVGKGAKRVQYHFQLIKRRGPFMMVQATRAGVMAASDVKLRHALDLEMGEQYYVVSGWKLKDLAADPTSLQSWSPLRFLAPVKATDSVFAFGMALSPENFTRHAIRRQLTMLDRVTVEGSSVTFGYRPTLDELDVLTTQLYSELFAKRFLSGALSKEMMARLKSVAGFSEAGVAQRVKAVATWCMVNAWEYTLGAVVGVVASMGDWLERVFSQNVADKLSGPVFQLAAERVDFETVVNSWKKTNGSKYRDTMRSITQFNRGNVLTVRGGLLAEGIADRTGGRTLTTVDRRLVNVLSTRVIEEDVLVSKSQGQELETTETHDKLVNKLMGLNAFDQPGEGRHRMTTQVAERQDDPDVEVLKIDQSIDPDYIGTMNEVYEKFNPDMNLSRLERDLASISLDPQDRQLHADKLRMPRLFSTQPKDRQYFRSKVLALGAPKRQETGPELVSAAAARNLAAPVVRLQQDESTLIPEIFENFIKTMCVPDAKEKLARYQKDPVGLEEHAYRDWMSQTRPDVLERVAKEVEESCVPLLEQDVGRYIMMLKADVKPPLSAKPLSSRIEPQVIVYHPKALSSMYSSIFRVLVRRFLSLLKPNVHVNLLKDMDDVKAFIQAVHPFGSEGMQYVENDFSKYDKSQDAFVFKLEKYFFEQLGMNQGFLERWVKGHENCRLFSFVTGLSLHLRFQRKSGDATTSFGNVLLNIVSVAYAYGVSDFAWALFMGDDSLIATRGVLMSDKAVDILAEVFNLTAKTYVTEQPYFASWFFMVIDESRRVVGLPDPIKRIEKWSQAVPADEPHWRERFVSAAQTCRAYAHKANTRWLGEMVSKRYAISVQDANRLPAAIYTATVSEENHRALHEPEAEWFFI